MSLSVYSYAFYRNAGLVGDETIAIPAGWTGVIRQVTGYVNLGQGPLPNFSYLRVKDGGTGATLVLFNNNFATGQPLIQYSTWEGRIVMGTGSAIVISSHELAYDVYVGGYLFQGTAPISIVGSPAP